MNDSEKTTYVDCYRWPATAREHVLGDLITDLRGETLPEQLALLLDTTEATVLDWEAAERPLTYEEGFAIERALGYSPGTLALEAGYLCTDLEGAAEHFSLCSPDRSECDLVGLLGQTRPPCSCRACTADGEGGVDA